MNKIFYFTNIAPHYRQKIWELLLSDCEFDLHFYYGKPSKKGRIKQLDFNAEPIKKNQKRLHEVKNIRVNNIIIWQTGVIPACLFKTPGACFFLGNMHIVSTWLAALLCRIKGIKVVFWGHGLYGKESCIKKKTSVFFHRLAHHHLLYNHRAKNLLQKYGINPQKMDVIYNSLNYDLIKHYREKFEKFEKSDHLYFFRYPDLPLLIFIGRLTKEKKLELLINALRSLNQHKSKYNLMIIGDGKQRNQLKAIAGELINQECVYFYGPSYKEKENGKYLSLADLCVSPGNVGLTAIHSLSYGTPVCTHDNFSNQGPEFEAVQPGKTGTFFKENNSIDLAEKIKEWFCFPIKNKYIEDNCYKMIDNYYNPYYQANIIKKIIVNYRLKYFR